MATLVGAVQDEHTFDIRKLKPRTRNQVRAVLSAPLKESVRLLNKIREDKSAKELLQIERVIRETKRNIGVTLSDLFPEEIQTKENFYRLSKLPPEKQIALVNGLLIEHKEKIKEFVKQSEKLGVLIVNDELILADTAIKKIISNFGHSNFILRKALLIQGMRKNPKKVTLPAVDELLDQAGIGVSNFIASSILRRYQEEQSTLSLKRSVMSLTDKGPSNKFTRDMTRLSFHPHAMGLDDLGEMIQSNLQSSLIDALIILKINRALIPENIGIDLAELFDLWDDHNVSIDDIASIYTTIEDGESLFYKHSSAWLENKEIIKYRKLQDHFYDDPDSNYFNINAELTNTLTTWIKQLKPEDVALQTDLTNHSHKVLKTLEKTGHITRSSIFNYYTHLAEGHAYISEKSLYKIMGATHELVKTTNISHLKNLAKYTDSSWARLIYYLLIAKRSATEVDDHRLRKLVEKLVQEEHDGSLLTFIEATTRRSESVAIFAYEVFTADFISKLTRIIRSSAQITETRADLHRWMGNISGEKRFLDRARTLLIDHKINLVRNELDDHRIYVDAARFDEWINDELMRELHMLFTSMTHNNNFANGEHTMLMQAIEKAYFSFCSNNKFGIASYLGRRIRHGTFKGHLYSSVVSIETHTRYSKLFKDPQFYIRWQQWKAAYESTIDNIIRNRLHIESNTKRDGLMKPTTKHVGKQEIALTCAKSLIIHFAEHKSTVGIPLILTEYCWRIADIDLRNVSSYLKGQKAALLTQEILSELSSNNAHRDLAKEFNRELTHLISEKLKTMHGWFKKPVSVAPKASLSLLYRAVVAEVKLYFPSFIVDTEHEENGDVEIMGGAYHVLYDALYVVVYNAAKYGKNGGRVERAFTTHRSPKVSSGRVFVHISSEIDDSDSEAEINERLKVLPDDDIENAQLYEVRSGIRKLHQLQRTDTNFNLVLAQCKERKVSVVMSYELELLS